MAKITFKDLFSRSTPVQTNATTDPIERVDDPDIVTQSDPISRTRSLSFGGIFTPFESPDVVGDNKETVTEAVWTSAVGGTMTTFHTGSTQISSSGEYYYDVYQVDPSASTAAVQFAITYGNRLGSGSAQINDSSGDTSLTPSKAIYSQYRNILLASTATQFTLGDSTTADSIIVINFKRARLKEQLDPGNWELRLSGSGEADRVTHYLQLTDDSSVNTNPTITNGGVVYNIVSGSSSATSPYLSGSGAYAYYGLMYPEHGVIVLDATAISHSIGLAVTQSVNIDEFNQGIFLQSMVSASSFSARNTQTISSTYYFVRVKNSEYNFSNNPSFTTGSVGDLRFSEMVKNPRTYLTTVGLYNDDNELLAVAKISQPLLKTFHAEANIKIKLDF